MPSVEMRRSTRVFVPKAKGGELVRVLRSGRRLWVDSSDAKHKGGGRNGGDWFPLLNDSGKLKQHKINGWHGLNPTVHDPIVQDPMDVDEAKPTVLEVSDRVAIFKDESNMFRNVYSRKRKRGNARSLGGFVDESKKFGLHFVRRQKRRTGVDVNGEIKGCVDQGILSVVVEASCVRCNFFPSILTSLLRYIGKRRIGTELLGFLVSRPISLVFASSGVHFLWNRPTSRSKGVCRIFGVRQMTAMFTIDFMAAPHCFQHLYFALLVRSVRLSYLWLIDFPRKNEEPLPYINVQSVSSRNNDVSDDSLGIGYINYQSVKNDVLGDKIENSPGIVLALAAVDSKDVKPAKLPSVAGNIRNVPSRVGVLTRSSSKRRRRSLRSRRARNLLYFVLQKSSGPPVSNHVSSKKPVSNHVSPKKNISSLKSVRRTYVNEIQVQDPSSSGLNVEIDSQCCSANILVVESDKCYRVEGAEVMLEFSASNEWLLVAKQDGLTRYSLKVQKEMRPGATNRFTHAFIWAAENGWKLEFPDRKEWVVFKELYKVCGERNIGPMSPVKIIPIPEVCELKILLDSPGAFKLPESYIRMTSDELSRTLSRRTANYDMDSEDEEWLSKFNSELDVSNHVSDESFELMIDAFEKASYCGVENVNDEKAAASLCFDVASAEVAEPVYRFWVKKRKQKCAPLIRAFQLNQPTRAPLIMKPVLRKKRSLKRPAIQSIQRGRGKDSSVLQEIAAEQYAAEEHSAMLRVKEAKASAEKSVELAIQKRQRAQFLMENADLAMYRATMALRIADAVAEILDSQQAANHFLD